tara:strand:- start:8222 stop:8575 length:354 start_codon:yes stop_codon:yes gene_type:complete
MTALTEDQKNKLNGKTGRFIKILDSNTDGSYSDEISNDDKDLLLRLKIVGTPNANIKAFIRSQAEGVIKKANYLRVYCDNWGGAVIHIESRSGHEEDEYFHDAEDNISSNISKLLNT